MIIICAKITKDIGFMFLTEVNMKTEKALLFLIVILILTGGGCGNGTNKEEKEKNFQISVVDTGADKASPDTAGSDNNVDPENSDSSVVAFISGEVLAPGVYELKKGSRINDLLIAAGGFTEEACTDYVNLAEILNDGEMIVIPSLSEAEELKKNETVRTGNYLKDNETGLVNMNTADAKKLQELPGIGKTKAEAIVSYRHEHGPFGSISEIKNVNGIGESIYGMICELITI